MNTIIMEDVLYILSDNNIDWKRFSGKTVIISGAAGFLPSYMTQTLLMLNKTDRLESNVKVIGLVRDVEKSKRRLGDWSDDPNLKIIKTDLSSPIEIDEDIDFIIHAASQASPKLFFTDPVGTIKANTLGTVYLLDLAVEKHVKGFLYFSTGEVNGDIYDRKEIVSENDYGAIDPLDVRSCYAESKRVGETLCAAYARQFGVPAKVVRPSHTYGPGVFLNDGRVFASFVSDVLNDKNIVLKSDGKANRCFLYLSDAVRGYFTVLLKGEAGIAYNVSNDYEITILDLANIIIKASGKTDLKVQFDITGDSSSAKNVHAMMDNLRLKLLGWTPEIKEYEGFSRVLKSFTEN